MTGRTGRASASSPRPGARGEHDLARRGRPRRPPSCSPSPRSPSSDARRTRRAAERAAGALERGRERGDEPPRVDRVVAGHVEREAHRRRQGGLRAPRLARPQPLDIEAELAPEREHPLERLGLVAVAGDHQRARRAQPGTRRPRRARRRRREAARARAGRARAARARRAAASVTGASMPAATCQAAGSPASSTTGAQAAPAARHAHARPIAPPPATATSNVLEVTAGHSLPTPALPGSGSTVGGPLPPSQPGFAGSRMVLSW